MSFGNEEDLNNFLDGNHIIAFRAFLDKIGDNFKAGHNKYKYNGRAESF